MRSLIVTEFISVDGVVDSPGGGYHPHAGWTHKDIEFVEAAYEIKNREQKEAGAMLMGRVSFQEFAAVWPSMAEFAGYNAMTKYVVSSTLTEAKWNNTTILRTLDDVAALKEGEGLPILLQGSATLAQNLAAAGMVDRYHLLEFPVLLGSGKRLFADTDAAETRLDLVEQASYSNGVRLAVYDVMR
jgi:dihydrofolate reductase